MRRRAAVSVCATMAVVAAGQRPVRAQATPEKLQVAAPISEGQTDLYYAIRAGLFTRAGLDVAIVSVTSGAAGTAAVITGSYDFAVTNTLSIFAAHLHGIPAVMVYPSIVNSAQNPFAQLQVPADSAVRTAADLNGRTVASPSLGDINSLAIRAWVDKNGGDSRTLKFVEIPNVALEAALAQHRVDAAVLLSPVLDASLAAGTTRTLGYAYGAIASRFMGSAYVARRDRSDERAETIRRFVRTLGEASRYVASHRAETAPLVAEYTKIALDNVQKMHRSETGGPLDPALIQPVIDVAARYGAVSAPFPARDVIWT